MNSRGDIEDAVTVLMCADGRDWEVTFVGSDRRESRLETFLYDVTSACVEVVHTAWWSLELRAKLAFDVDEKTALQRYVLLHRRLMAENDSAQVDGFMLDVKAWAASEGPKTGVPSDMIRSELEELLWHLNLVAFNGVADAEAPRPQQWEEQQVHLEAHVGYDKVAEFYSSYAKIRRKGSDSTAALRQVIQRGNLALLRLAKVAKQRRPKTASRTPTPKQKGVSTAPNKAAPGKLYGDRWECVDEVPLGTGGQGVVFRVLDKRGEHDGHLALKRVIKGRGLKRFADEVSALRRLNHAKIMRVLDWSAFDDGGPPARAFLVMPMAKGGSLVERVAMYKGSLTTTLGVARQIADALAHAHDNGVVHRDIKPENILFWRLDHECVLTDFGICFFLAEEARKTEEGEVVGARHFMAPELELGGRLDVTPAADVYSLGKVIYYMISGGVILPRERHRDPEYDVFGSPRLAPLGVLLDQMICDSPSQRLPSMDAVLRALDQIVETGTAPAYEFSPDHTTPPSDLKEVDERILSALFERALSSNRVDGAAGRELDKFVEELEVDEQTFGEAARFLDERGLLDATLGFGGAEGVIGVTLSAEGVERLASQRIAGYSEMAGRARAAVAKGAATTNHELAEKLGTPLLIACHLLEAMEAEGVLKLARDSEGVWVHDVAASLKREFS